MNRDQPHRGLSLIIPAYNEEANISKAIEANIVALDGIGIEYEILVINDGSLDSTASKVRTLQARCNKDLSLYHHDKNKGMGAAIRTGIGHSKYELIAFAPADNPLEAIELSKFLREIDSGADLVVGYRKRRPGYNLIMSFNSRIYKLLLSYFSGLCLRDFNWIHLYKKEIFESISLNYNGVFMMAELFIKAHRAGFDIREVESKMARRIYGRPSATRAKVILQTALDFFDFFIWHRLKGTRAK